MFCSNCGQRLADDAKHCPNCGMLIRRDTEAPETDPGRPETGSTSDYNSAAYTYSYGARSEGAQPAPGTNPYYPYPAPVQPTKADGYALTGLILAIVSGVCCCIPFIGLPCAILGIIFSAKGMQSETRRTMAVIGLILAIIFVLCNAVTTYSLIVTLSKADTWADIMNGSGFDFDSGFDFRFR